MANLDRVEFSGASWRVTIGILIFPVITLLVGERAAWAQLKDASASASYVTGTVGIGTTSPAVSLDLGANTDALALPRGTSAQRPSASNGMIRFNSDLGMLEIYFNSTWNILFPTGGAVAVTLGGTGTSSTFTQGSVVFAGASGVYSQDNANFLWDDSNHRLGIGTASPAVTLDLSTKTDALALPSGTTAQRPASPALGMTRYNSTIGGTEIYQGNNAMWAAPMSTSYKIDLTGQTGNIAATTLFTPTVNEFYTLCGALVVTTTGTTGSMQFAVKFTETNGIAMTFSLGLAVNINGLNVTNFCVPFFASAGNAVQYQVTGVTVAGSLQYSLHVRFMNMP